jgi:hypothetical protein
MAPKSLCRMSSVGMIGSSDLMLESDFAIGKLATSGISMGRKTAAV